MAIKIDLEKAYDRLKWSFIQETLEDMQLPHILMEVIMCCVITCSLSVLWNGESTDRFRPTRGIRQVDPLSPYLFAACMKKLSQLIEMEVQKWKVTLDFNKPKWA